MTNPVPTAQEVSVVTIRVSNFSKRFPIWNAVRTELSWTHYRTPLRIENELRAELEKEQRWLVEQGTAPK